MTEELERETNVEEIPVTQDHVTVEKHDRQVTLRLLDAALWQAFRQEGTEMIITKAGRSVQSHACFCVFCFQFLSANVCEADCLFSVQPVKAAVQINR